MWSLRFNAEASLEVLMFATLVASQKFCTAPEISVGGVKKKKEKEKNIFKYKIESSPWMSNPNHQMFSDWSLLISVISDLKRLIVFGCHLKTTLNKTLLKKSTKFGTTRSIQRPFCEIHGDFLHGWRGAHILENRNEKKTKDHLKS